MAVLCLASIGGLLAVASQDVGGAVGQGVTTTIYDVSTNWWIVAVTVASAANGIAALLLALAQARSSKRAYRVAMLSYMLSHLMANKDNISDEEFKRWMESFAELMRRWTGREVQDLHDAIEQGVK